NPFKTENTKEAPFKALGSEEMKVAMMQQSFRMRVYQDKDVQVVFCPMAKDASKPGLTELEACIVLPRDTSFLQNVYKGVSSEMIAKWDQSSSYEMVDLYLPQCSLRQRQSLKKALQTLGLKQAFSNSANFTKLSPGLELAIDDVIHEAYMQLDEAG